MKRQSFVCSAGIVVLICFTFSTPARAQDLSDLPKIQPEISASAAATLEDKLKTNPDDLGARAQLLDYYFVLRISNRSADIEQKREAHVFWLIEHHPESDLAGAPQAEILPIEPIESADGYQRAKQIWLEQIEKHPSDIRVLRNAASFFTTSDPKQSRDLLNRAALANPADRETMAMLAQSYELQTARFESPDEKKTLAEKALALREQALDKTDPEKRFYGLEEVAVDAFGAGEIVKAQQYASELLKPRPEIQE